MLPSSQVCMGPGTETSPIVRKDTKLDLRGKALFDPDSTPGVNTSETWDMAWLGVPEP